MKTTYRNPWHQPSNPMYGPVMFETDAKPIEHAGHLIFQVVKGRVWDVVKDGACVTQRAGINGAKDAAEVAAGLISWEEGVRRGVARGKVRC